MTPAYFDNDWMQSEANFAVYEDPAGQRNFAIPILRETCEIPPLIQSLRRFDFRDDAKFEENCRQFVAMLRVHQVESRPASVDESKIPRVRQLKVFLCHSSDDKPAVRQLYRRLLNESIDPWLDEEKLLPGQDWQFEIWKAVRSSDIVIACFSRGSITKDGFVQKEIKYALDLADEKPEGTLFLIPVKLEECDIPERLRRWQWLDFFEKGSYEKLMRSLRNRADALGLSS
jgi:hypothetical protein